MSLNRVIGRSSVVVVGVLVAVGVTACPPSSWEECENGVCDVVAPADGGGTDADASSPTDSCLTKPDDPPCVTDESALFVSSAAADGNGDGTKAKPFKSLGVALGKISAEKKRIYVCGDAHPEDVVLEAKHSGVSIFGVGCDWRATSTKPRFGAGTLALKITGATGLAIADVAFVAKDATTAGGSSIAALVANAEVTFKSVSLEAGKGVAGADGKLVPFTFPAASELQGKNGDPPGNGGATSVKCPGDMTTSTTGGAGGESGVPGQPGTPGSPNGGTTNVCTGPTSVNTDGQAGVITAPAASSTTRGGLTADGWAPHPPVDGAKGGAGQGGGGGYGSGGGGARGGGGGAGGCGGAGGGGGGGGGSSIALASMQSTVRFVTSSLRANDAGKGGKGVDGQAGQAQGGAGGTKSSGSTSCNGGNGGPGAKGAEGAGGAGGSSIGVLYIGPKPELDSAATNIAVQSLGAGGTGGKPGPGGNDGLPGVAEEVQDATKL